VRRRNFIIAVFTSAAVWPVSALAQRSKKPTLLARPDEVIE
jgi:hypothetical protein